MLHDEHPPDDDPRLFFPATERNRDALIEAITPWLPSDGAVLELASGSGEHVTYFAQRAEWSRLRWLPSDPDPTHRASVDAWARARGVDDRVEPATAIDTTAKTWPVTHADAVLCCNMIHIAPWAACLGMLDGCARILAPGARLLLYGPFMRDNQHTAPSNEAFDARLRSRDPSWGVRDMEVVTREAATRGMTRRQIIPMPANNFTVIFERHPDPDDAHPNEPATG